MTKEEARTLLPLVNDPHVMDLMLSYSKMRIDKLRQQYDLVEDMVLGARLQGAVREMQKFVTLREEVNQVMKNG